MRKTIEQQMQFGEVDIAAIEFDLRSRDEIPKLLMGLQYIYCTPEISEQVFRILEGIVPKDTDPHNGRPGMKLWKILVLGVLRLNCNWDYDKLQEIANNHRTLRQMLGHGMLDEDYRYALQTLKDNVSLLTPEILDRINQVVVNAGHNIMGKKKEGLNGKCDSFVVETAVHFPTDINLLFDSIRKVISLIAMVCSGIRLSDWRKHKDNIKKIKRLFRKIQNLRHSTSKDEKKKAAREELIVESHRTYLEVVSTFLEKAKSTIKTLLEGELAKEDKLQEIERYIWHGERQIDQIQRRVIQGEIIPHADKYFSVFQEHTEWISKGKAGVPQELGLRVCILKDEYSFILHHQVLEKQTDDKVAVSMVRGAKDRFPALNGCSFDKGFYTPSNILELKEIIDHVILPKKGRLSEKDKAVENSGDFVQARRGHSAVESAINALENHGLDRCPDHGTTAFKRYVGLAILARNIQILGNLLQQKALKSRERCERLKRRKLSKWYRSAA